MPIRRGVLPEVQHQCKNILLAKLHTGFSHPKSRYDTALPATSSMSVPRYTSSFGQNCVYFEILSGEVVSTYAKLCDNQGGLAYVDAGAVLPRPIRNPFV